MSKEISEAAEPLVSGLVMNRRGRLWRRLVCRIRGHRWVGQPLFRWPGTCWFSDERCDRCDAQNAWPQ